MYTIATYNSIVTYSSPGVTYDVSLFIVYLQKNHIRILVILMDFWTMGMSRSRISRLVGRQTRWWRRPPMRALFSENVCKNERVGSRWGEGGRSLLHSPMLCIICIIVGAISRGGDVSITTQISIFLFL